MQKLIFTLKVYDSILENPDSENEENVGVNTFHNQINTSRLNNNRRSTSSSQEHLRDPSFECVRSFSSDQNETCFKKEMQLINARASQKESATLM